MQTLAAFIAVLSAGNGREQNTFCLNPKPETLNRLHSPAVHGEHVFAPMVGSYPYVHFQSVDSEAFGNVVWWSGHNGAFVLAGLCLAGPESA